MIIIHQKILIFQNNLIEVFLITQIEKIPFFEKNVPDLCPECEGTIITDNYKGETICQQCGLITSEKALDCDHFGMNIFSPEEMRLRGQNGDFHTLFIPKLHFHTIIKLNKIIDYNFKRIARLDNQNDKNDNGARNLLTATREVKQISSNLRLPYSIKRNAMLLYRKALNKSLIRGRSILGMVCACLYYACRKAKLPISFQEIVSEGYIKANLVTNCYRTLLREFNLRVPPLGPALFVSRYISELALNIEIEKRVLSVLKNLPISYINGKDPKGLIGGIIYMVGKKEQLRITQKRLSVITGTCEVTIRNKSREIKNIISLQDKNLFSI